MNTTSTSTVSDDAGSLSADSLPSTVRTIYRLLDRVTYGRLSLIEPGGTVRDFGQARAGEPHAALVLRNWDVCGAALKSGDIGFAETYIDGHWTTPDLTALIRFFVGNRRAVDDMIFGTWWGRLAYRLRHLLNRNTKRNSQKNIHAHYDLGNDFYKLWLDETMNYSSAWYSGQPHAALSMPQAQVAKVHRALSQVQLQPGQRVLEIGCGWGALAEAATRDFGAHITGLTLSSEQLAWAQERMAAIGQSAKADLRLQDYRDVTDAPFDAICSIEMVEAVGREYWPTYFQTVARLLKPGGRACIQSIVIADEFFERYLSGTDFIQQYIFPGGCLPSQGEIVRQAKAAGLQVEVTEAFGADYAHTLAWWHQRFNARAAEVRALGFDERFLRIWSFYLAYCEAGFAERSIDVVQVTLRRPD